MPSYLTPQSNVTFHKIFGEHAHLLISLLNALLPLEEGRQVVEVSYLQLGYRPEILLGLCPLVMAECKDTRGQIFIVEMDMCGFPAFDFLLEFKASRVLMKHSDGDCGRRLITPTKALYPSYSLAIVVGRFAPKHGKRWYYRYKVADIDKPKRILEGMELIVVDLQKFNPDRAELMGWTMDRKRMAVLWLRFLKDTDEESTPDPELLADERIKEALELCEEGRYTPGEMAAYESYWNNLRWQLIWPDMKDKLEELKRQEKETKMKTKMKMKRKRKRLEGKIKKLEEKERALLAEKDNALATPAAELEALKQQLAAALKLK